MKTTSKLKIVLIILMTGTTVPSFAITTPPITPTAITNTPAEEAQTEILISRLKVIRDMDKSNLSRTDRKVLRKEIRDIKSTLKASRGGLYISVGAAIIIVLLLILIL